LGAAPGATGAVFHLSDKKATGKNTVSQAISAQTLKSASIIMDMTTPSPIPFFFESMTYLDCREYHSNFTVVSLEQFTKTLISVRRKRKERG
jgi:hypothetical protein